MTRREYVILRKMLSYINDIDETVTIFGDSFDNFSKSNPYLHSVSKCIEYIGELSKFLSDEFLSSSDNIPWHEIRGMRNRFVHDYFNMKREVIWDVVKTDIPILRDFVVKQLESETKLSNEYAYLEKSEIEKINSNTEYRKILDSLSAQNEKKDENR
jgi:uncharacterized protein with HEPN domain